MEQSPDMNQSPIAIPIRELKKIRLNLKDVFDAEMKQEVEKLENKLVSLSFIILKLLAHINPDNNSTNVALINLLLKVFYECRKLENFGLFE